MCLFILSGRASLLSPRLKWKMYSMSVEVRVKDGLNYTTEWMLMWTLLNMSRLFIYIFVISVNILYNIFPCCLCWCRSTTAILICLSFLLFFLCLRKVHIHFLTCWCSQGQALLSNTLCSLVWRNVFFKFYSETD